MKLLRLPDALGASVQSFSLGADAITRSHTVDYCGRRVSEHRAEKEIPRNAFPVRKEVQPWLAKGKEDAVGSAPDGRKDVRVAIDQPNLILDLQRFRISN